MSKRLKFRTVALLIALVTVISLTISFFPAAADSDTACIETTGSITRNTYRSHQRDEDFVYSIYLPPCYATSDSTFPVIYLMHGSDSDDSLWIELGLPHVLDKAIYNGDIPPVVVVMPYGDDIFNTNTFTERSWASVFVNDLLPEIETHYHVGTTFDQRAIGGISRGGFWAYHIALLNPTLFSAVAGHSAVFTPDNAIPEYNPIYLVVTAKGIEPIRFWLDRAAADYSGPTMNTMVSTMQYRQLNLIYRVFHLGNHNNDYWSSHLKEYLDFYTQEWQ